MDMKKLWVPHMMDLRWKINMKVFLEQHGHEKLYCPICSKPYRAVHDYALDDGPPYCEGDMGLYSDNPVYLVKRMGPYGLFAGCPNFPKCKYSISLECKKVNIDYNDELRPY